MQAPTAASSADIWMVITAIATAVAGIFAAVAASISFFQGRSAERGQRASISFEISRRYDQLYPRMIELRKSPVKWEEFHRKYPTEQEKLGSDEWKLLREVGGFFELIGALVDEKVVYPQLLFKFMNIRPQLWSDNEETILKMRETYNKELWVYWGGLVKLHDEFKKRHAAP